MGGSRLSDDAVFASYENDEQEAGAIRYSLEKGQDHIDTAQLYGAGHTEEIVGRALNGFPRDRVFLATKIWKSHAASVTAVRKAVEDSLRKMKTDYVDLIYTHAVWDAIPMEVYIEGLNRVVDAGLARFVGVSNFALEDLKRAVAMSDQPIVANQLLYNILERGRVTSELLEFCRRHNITVVAYRPVERRLLADQATNELTLQLARNYGRPVSHIAISWLIGQPGVVTIPKAVTRTHIDENLGATDLVLEAEDRAALDALATSSG
jgi:diketogulonate reductase-like aldo/keto reductase